MEKIIINLPYIQEEIFIGENILEEIKKIISNKDYDKFLVVIDNQAYKKHLVYFESLFKYLNIHKSNLVFLKPKPQYKDLEKAQFIIKQLITIGASRKTCIIAIGGGYVGDLIGFVSSIYMRGIDFIQISTTLMSQCDGVIGKVAVNFKNIKNLTGTFYSPKMIFCDINFIKSFSKIEQLYGLVEIWKYAILVNDLKIILDINMYLEDKKSLDYKSLINFSLLTKKYFVEDDPFDRNGHHKALSLGHTIANVLETDPSFRHGLAVFYGIVFESIIANNVSKISDIKYNEIMYTASLFESHFNKLQKIKKILCNKHTLNILKFDKINSYGTYSFVIPTNDGYFIYRDIPMEIINKAMENFLNLNNTFTNLK